MENLSESVKHSQAITTAAGVAGTTELDGATLDMAGFDCVRGMVVLGVITAGAATSIKWQEGAASDASDMADLAGTGVTVADTDDGKTVLTSMICPTKRYVRLVVLRATQNAVVAYGGYDQFRASKRPISGQGTAVSSVVFMTPAEGTP